MSTGDIRQETVNNGAAGSVYAILSNMVENQQTPFEETWAFFLANFGSASSPALKQPSFKDLSVRTSGILFRSLLQRAVSEWSKNPTAKGLPDPLRATLALEKSKLVKRQLWGTSLWELTFNAHEAVRLDSPHKTTVVLELMRFWQQFLFRFHKHPKKQNIPSDWTCLPDPASYSRQVIMTDFCDRLSILAPRYESHHKDNTMAAAALLTFDVLCTKRDTNGLSQEQALAQAPLVTILAHTIRYSDFLDYSPVLSGLLRKHNPDPVALQQIQADIKKFPLLVNNVLSHAIATEDGKSSEDAQLNFLLKRLARITEQQQIRALDKFWQEAKETFELVSEDRSKDAVPARFYNSLLFSYMSKQRPDKAIALWNEMVQRGTQPGNGSWTALLSGCRTKVPEDADKLENLWQKMISTGLMPDSYNWSSRVYGLMSSTKWSAGLNALYEMGLSWENSVKKLQDYEARLKSRKLKKDETAPAIAAKPDASTVNAALGVLARRGSAGRKHIGRVLTWAQRYQIQPDNFTFNILIGMEMRSGQYDQATKLLKQMEARQIKPDIVTFAIMIKDLFQSDWIRSAAQEEIVPKVVSVLQTLEEYNLRPNDYIYTTIIDGFLKERDDVGAALSILQYMDKLGIKTPAPASTALATYYLNQTPPNIQALDALWTRVQRPGSLRDHLLYDRFITAYGRNGEIGKMMTVLMRMSMEGKRPHWISIATVIKGLVSIGDMARAKEVVQDVARGTGNLVFGVRGLHNPKNSEMFWETVEELGLKDANHLDQNFDMGGDEVVAFRGDEEVILEDGGEPEMDFAGSNDHLEKLRSAGPGSIAW